MYIGPSLDSCVSVHGITGAARGASAGARRGANVAARCGRKHGPGSPAPALRPRWPRRHRDRRHARDRPRDRGGLRRRRCKGGGGEPQAGRLRRDGAAPRRHGRRGARRANAPRRARGAAPARRAYGRALRSPRHPREQRGERAPRGPRPLHPGRLGEVLRRQPAGPRLPDPGGAPLAREEPLRVGRERDLGRRVPRELLPGDVRRRQGRAAALHALDGRRVRPARDPRERARARHRGHGHGAQQHARDAEDDGGRELHEARRLPGRDGGAGALPRVRCRELRDRPGRDRGRRTGPALSVRHAHRVRRQRPRRGGDRRRRLRPARRAGGAAHRPARPRDGAPRRGVLRQAARDHVQLGVVGALPGDRAPRPRRGRRDPDLAAYLLYRHRPDAAQPPRPGLRRHHARHLPDRRGADRGQPRAPHARHPRPEPHRELPRLGRDPGDRRPPRAARGRGLLRLPRRHAGRDSHRNAQRPERHELRALPHHHGGGDGRHGAGRRPAPRGPLPAPAPLGTPQRGQILRQPEGRAALLLGPRRDRVRRPLHLRRARLELRAVRALGRLRRMADAEARREPRPAPAELRGAERAPRRAPGTLHPAPHHAGGRDGVAHVSDPDPAGVGDPARAPATVHGGERRRHAHGVDRQRRPPAGLPGPADARRRGGARERRPRDGVGPDPADEPRARRPPHALHRRSRRRLREGARGVIATRLAAAGAAACALAWAAGARAYPIDGAAYTGIGRLAYQERLQAAGGQGAKRPPGELLPLAAVDVRLAGREPLEVPAPDPALTAALRRLLGAQAERYGLALLDLSDPERVRYAEWNGRLAQNPGSVGKLVVALAIFQALADAHPGDIPARERVLRERIVVADAFSVSDHHTVPFFDPVAGRFTRRPMRPGDSASLWTYLDWMLSPSSNSAAGMLQREILLMRRFGSAYPPSPEEQQRFLAETPKKELGALFAAAIQEPVTRNGLDLAQLRQGSFFTHEGKKLVPGTSSHATARELVRYLLRMEQGRLVDEWSSREIKRLLYQTERRIRYASAPALADAAVYFKSGSLYSCQPEPDFVCRKYHGNVRNYMNSAAVIESPAGERRLFYLVALLSNVLRMNSAADHAELARAIHARLLADHAERQ